MRGFSLIEVIIVLFIFGTIVSLPWFFLWGIGRSEALRASTREVVAVLHEAHTYTLSGRSIDGEQPSSYGIYLQPGYYVLFAGSSYNVTDPNNQRTDLPDGITFSQIQVPASSVVFTKVTGQVANFDPSQNFIELLDTNTQETRLITISMVGGITYD